MELGPVSHGSQWHASSSVELGAFSQIGALSSNPYGQPQHVASTGLVVVSVREFQRGTPVFQPQKCPSK